MLVSRTRTATFSRLLSRAQFTATTRYTLSYICGHGLTYIYTKREEGPSGERKERRSRSITGGVETHFERNRRTTTCSPKLVSTHLPHSVTICTRVSGDARCTCVQHVMRFCENENDHDPHNSVLEKFASGLSQFC